MTLPLIPQRPTLGRLLMQLPVRFRWTLHNIVGHPISEVLFLLNFPEQSEWVHNVTAPDEAGEDHG